eukprot:TCONS_00001703-protein
MNTVVTSEYLPTPFHGGRVGGGSVPNTSTNDLSTENTFRWPHAAISGERTSPVAITTNGYNFLTDRTIPTGAPTTNTDASGVHRFTVSTDPYKFTPYDSAIPPSTAHQQDFQRFDPYGNQFRNAANFYRKSDLNAQEQVNVSMTLPPDTRGYPTPPNQTVANLSQPPLPSATLNQPPPSAFQNTMSTTGFQTPPTYKPELRMDFHDDANRPRSYSQPNYVDNNFIPTPHHHMMEGARPTSTGLMGGEMMQQPKQDQSPENSTKNEVQKIMQQQMNKTESKTPEKTQDVKNEPISKDNTTKTGTNNGQPQTENGLPSYTAMIAQAILKKESSKSTLSDIYEYMEKHFPSLEKRGTGWRNCVRHTLSLNDCFIKLHRPENGRSCNWAIHPTYYESFSKGDYRKRRALRKRPRGLQWIDPVMLAGYQFAREHDVYPEMHQQPSPFYHYPPHPATAPPATNMHPGSPQGYYHSSSVGNFNQNFSAPPSTHLQQPPAGIQHYSPHQNYAGPPQPGTSGHHHMSNAPHCTNPDCYCQFSKQTRTYTP